jgi:homoserine O-acetyltransferase
MRHLPLRLLALILALPACMGEPVPAVALAERAPAPAASAAASPGPAPASAPNPASSPAPVEGDCTLRDFRFQSGESLAELRIHYTTLGTPARDAAGVVRNAVLILHGTTGSGRPFLAETFAGRLFRAGQLLDAAHHFIVLPDGIGTGRSSRPSEGLHMRFPKYTYDDMVRAQHELLTGCLGVNHLRLVLGTSMGAMHTWVWGYTYPDFMDALMPLASLPVEIAGRNRMLRKMIADSITGDPEWKQGDYTAQPRGLIAATHVMIFMVSSPLQWQKEAPTRDKAEALLDTLVHRYASTLDANDMIYQFEASRFYNPLPHLGDIRAPLYAVNSADDQINPPELGILDEAIHRVPRGRYILLPITPDTRGHGTHSLPAIWGKYLAELLAESEPHKP